MPRAKEVYYNVDPEKLGNPSEPTGFSEGEMHYHNDDVEYGNKWDKECLAQIVQIIGKCVSEQFGRNVPAVIFAKKHKI